MVVQRKILDTRWEVWYTKTMEDFFKKSILFDIYGNLLSKNQKLVYEFHILDDLSFNEIGEELKITRQAAYDLFKTADKKLIEYENKLMLYKKFNDIEKIAKKIKNISFDKKVINLLEEIINITKMEEKV